MPAIAIPGPEGRLEARFSPPPRPRAPIAMILHPHPQAGGTMNDRITQQLYKTFVARGFGVLRFNFRGVGRSEANLTMVSVNCPTPHLHSIGSKAFTLKRPLHG